MIDDRRRFLRAQLRSSALFLAGAAAGSAAGAGGMYLHGRAVRNQPGQVKHSYAQQGEDLILWNITSQFLRLHPVTYLDVGAHDPIAGSNTFLFYEKGYRGVLVEPNPALWDALAATRPRDTLLRAGIGTGKETEADYYVLGGDGGLNTFSKEVAEAASSRTGGRFSVQQVIRLPLIDINQVMRRHWDGAPNLLSIDTEGFDLQILASLDFRQFRPNVVCVETLEFDSRKIRQPILDLMLGAGYDVRGATFVNTIFVDRRHTS